MHQIWWRHCQVIATLRFKNVENNLARFPKYSGSKSSVVERKAKNHTFDSL